MFTSSFLMSIMFSCVVISLVVIYINYKMSEQDHKISSMLALISTMAQELDFFRRKMLDNSMSDAVGGKRVSHHSMSFELEPNNKLIEVSDEDSQSSDNDEDYEDEDEDDQDDDDDDDEEGEEGEDDNNENENENENVKVLNIHLGNDQSSHMLDTTHFKKLDNERYGVSDNDENESDDDVDLEDDIISINSSDLPNVISNTSTDLTDTIHLEELMSNNTNLQFLKSVDINGLVNNDDNDTHTTQTYSVDYKKMSVQKLRSIAIEKGIHVDVSKMKKNEILNLLLNP